MKTKKFKLNPILVGVHLVFIIGYTIISVLRFNVKWTKGVYDGVGNTVISVRIQTLFTLFSCCSDIFLVCMFWYILQTKSGTHKDERLNYTYEVLDVIKDSDHLNHSSL